MLGLPAVGTRSLGRHLSARVRRQAIGREAQDSPVANERGGDWTVGDGELRVGLTYDEASSLQIGNKGAVSVSLRIGDTTLCLSERFHAFSPFDIVSCS